MLQKFIPYARFVVALLLLCAMAVTATSCAGTWSWLWSRSPGQEVDSADLILGGNVPEDTDVIYEGAVQYTGEAHSGTDIYYIGKAGNPNRSRIIVIDAGHQLKGSSTLEPNGPGSDVLKAEVSDGAEGEYTGQKEYELNLAVALRLRTVLIDRGYSVVMIRETNNVSISNMERAEIANKYNAAAYIRIHANSWTDKTMHGAMTFSQTANNPYPDCARHYERSKLLSTIVLDEFCEQTGIHKIEVRESDTYTGTNWSRVPTTIVEMGFLSNKSDDDLMKSGYFRQEAALGIANGLDRYFAELEKMEPEPETDVGFKPQDTSPKPIPEPQPTDTSGVTEEPLEDGTEAQETTEGLDESIPDEITSEEPDSEEIPPDQLTPDDPDSEEIPPDQLTPDDPAEEIPPPPEENPAEEIPAPPEENPEEEIPGDPNEAIP